MSHNPRECEHRHPDGRTAWTVWRHGLRYTGKPNLEPCMRRHCTLCLKFEEIARCEDPCRTCGPSD